LRLRERPASRAMASSRLRREHRRGCCAGWGKAGSGGPSWDMTDKERRPSLAVSSVMATAEDDDGSKGRGATRGGNDGCPVRQ